MRTDVLDLYGFYDSALGAAAKRIECRHVATREETGLSKDAAQKAVIFSVQISDTGAGAKPASYFALEHTAAKRWFDANL